MDRYVRIEGASYKEVEKATVLLPCLNEKEGIIKTIGDIQPVWFKGCMFEVVVADGGSTDGTLEEIKRYFPETVRVVSCPIKGKGNQVQFALKQIDSDYVIMLDSDYTYPPNYIPIMLDMLRGSKYNVITGSRIKGEIQKEAMSKSHWIGNWLLTTLANLLYPLYTSDLCTGYWALGKGWRELNIRAQGFELEANLFTECCRLGLRIGEVPIYYRRRQGNSAPKLKMKNALGIAWWLIKEKRWK